MGGVFSASTSTAFPASTATLCVLPLRTHGRDRFAITPAPMPQQLGTRLAEVEYHGIIAGVNSALEPLSGFGVLSLLLPFLLVDLLALVTLTSVDPFLLISPWDYAPADLLLPLGIEFLILFISFPLMAYAVNRRMEEVQHRVRVLLDDSSRRYGPRGLSFQLKQGVLNNGAATNLWVEVLVVPLVHVQSPVPVPVPTVCPVLVPAQSPQQLSQQAGSTSAATTPAGPAVTPAQTPDAAPSPGFGSPATPAASTSSAGRNQNLEAHQIEYLRVLQENQLLRQYLSQCQALIHQLASQANVPVPPPPVAPPPQTVGDETRI